LNEVIACIRVAEQVSPEDHQMSAMSSRLLAAAALAAAFTISPAGAQQPQTQLVRGAIASVDGSTIVVKSRDGAEAKVKLADNVTVSGSVKKTIADIKPGNYVGVGAVPQADGSQKAVRINIFAEAQRGAGEGHRSWEGAPNGTMTNATVATSVASVGGQEMMVKYKDGEKKIIVTPETLILASVPGDKSELKPGANISIANAAKQPDGTFQAARITVGRDGVVP
jgi:uncharacterized protein DUF5666